MGTESGLVSAWNLNKDDSNAIRAWDANTTGARNAELISGPRWDMNITQTPVEFSDLNFDGTNDYIDTGTSSVFDVTQNMSLLAWQKMPQDFIDTSNAIGGIFAKAPATPTRWLFYYRTDTGPTQRG